MARSHKIYLIYNASCYVEMHYPLIGAFTVKHEVCSYLKKWWTKEDDHSDFQVISVCDANPDGICLDITKDIKEMIDEI